MFIGCERPRQRAVRTTLLRIRDRGCAITTHVAIEVNNYDYSAPTVSYQKVIIILNKYHSGIRPRRNASLTRR